MIAAELGSEPRSPVWHTLQADEALESLGSSPEGLEPEEARLRLERVGPNLLEAVEPASAFRILADQLSGLVVLLLFAAALVALAMGDAAEAAAIGAVLVLNTGIGFATELRARRAMEALLALDVPAATVRRRGDPQEVDARELVPGDVIEVDDGDRVPADARLLSDADLRVDEAALTGESLPIIKGADDVYPAHEPLPERRNMVYKGTTVTGGAGRAVVVGTGVRTEVGRIGQLVSRIPEERTPLERRLDVLGRRLVWITLGVAAAVTAVGLLRGRAVGAMIEAGIALAIAAVPEGLPAVATIALAVGLRRMARRRALVRRLPAVEALGSATVVCADKTGTLTAGEMTATALWLPDRSVRITGEGYEPTGRFEVDGEPIEPTEDEPLLRALQIGALANRAAVSRAEGGWSVSGDPTDASLLVAARKAGLRRSRLLEQRPSAGEVPFSSRRRLAASFHRTPGGVVAYVKGAPPAVADRCRAVLTPQGERPLDEGWRRRIEARNAALAAEGLRVLALAQKGAASADESELREMTFVGLVGIIDPPARGVKETIGRFTSAGVRTVMLTGDQPLTAEAIARELGMLTEGEATLDAGQLHGLSERELERRIGRLGAFSRISPEDKLRIVTAFQSGGSIVAMLGDGVNDAAALKKADVGVSMGRRGTDVAKEAADVILLDDRFPTLSAAIEEGRVIFDNIRKFVYYLFSCNFAEVLILFVAGVVGLPLPLLPLQILWLNLVTDTFPALSLAFEPAESDIMERPPRDPTATLLSRRTLRSIGLYGALIAAVTLVAFVWAGGSREADLGHARTVGFMTLALAQVFHLGNARSPDPVLDPASAVRNRWALGAVAVSVGLQLLALSVGPLAERLELVPLGAEAWAVVLILAAIPAIFGQVVRTVRRHS